MPRNVEVSVLDVGMQIVGQEELLRLQVVNVVELTESYLTMLGYKPVQWVLAQLHAFERGRVDSGAPLAHRIVWLKRRGIQVSILSSI